MNELQKEITDRKGIRSYIDALKSRGWDYHLEDEVRSIVWIGGPEPTEDEKDLLDKRSGECCDVDIDFAFEVLMEGVR